MIAAELRPLALARHTLVLLVAAGLVALGQWQLARLDQVRAVNEQAAQRMAMPAVGLDVLVAEVGSGPLAASQWATALDDPGRQAMVEHRRVEVTGHYVIDQEVLHRNREHQGRSGFHLLTPLALDGHDADLVLLVRRGWVPSEHTQPPVAAAMPPTGQVTVSGIIELPVDQPRFGAQDPPDGDLARVFHADTGRLDGQIDGDLLPLVLRLEHPDGAARSDAGHDPLALPVPLGPPQLDEASHLSYAVQWHIFAVLAAGTYVAWIVKQRRRPRSTSASPGWDTDRPPDAETSRAPARRP